MITIYIINFINDQRGRIFSTGVPGPNQPKENDMPKKFMIIVTHSSDDRDKADSAIALAVSLPNEEADVAMFSTFEGAHMARKGVAGGGDDVP